MVRNAARQAHAADAPGPPCLVEGTGGGLTGWLGGLTVTYDEHGDTILTGPVVDQSALHGLLKKVRDLGLPLISVNRIELNANGES